LFEPNFGFSNLNHHFLNIRLQARHQSKNVNRVAENQLRSELEAREETPPETTPNILLKLAL
jgi:hypothetical protein